MDELVEKVARAMFAKMPVDEWRAGGHFDFDQFQVFARAALAASDRDVLVEAAWREGWSTGYRSGMTDGGSDSCWCDEAGDWEKSNARAALTPLAGGVE